MDITITAIENDEVYFVRCVFFTEDLGHVETSDLVRPHELGQYLYERLPYKAKSDIFANVKAVK